MISLADPERALASAYAPPSLRVHLIALFALDERLGAIVAATTEPTIGLIRLAWWREALEKLDRDGAPAEPLLFALVGSGIAGADMAAIEDGWAALLDGEPNARAIARHGHARGRALFAAAAALLGARDDGLADAGAGWALADLGHRHSAPAVRAVALAQARALLIPLRGRRWSRPALPLAALAILAACDASRSGMRRQGSPGRVLRLLALRLTRR